MFFAELGATFVDRPPSPARSLGWSLSRSSRRRSRTAARSVICWRPLAAFVDRPPPPARSAALSVNHTVAHAPRSCSIQIGGVQSFYKKPAAAGWDWPMECVFRDLKSKASTNAAFVARDVLGTVGQLQHGTVTPGRSARPSAPLVVSPTLSTHAARRGGNALDRETIMTDRRVFIIRAKRVSNCYMREKKK